MGMLADEVDVVIGVDTHRDRHALAVVDAAGGVRHELAVDACLAGYESALGAVAALAPGLRVWAIEGAGGYGAGLCRHLLGAGERVVEVERPARSHRPGGRKSDPLDAQRAAREALASAQLAVPRTGGEREALRVLSVTRALVVTDRTAVICQIKSLIVAAPDDLRGGLRGLSTRRQLRRCAGLRPHHAQPIQLRAIGIALRSAARRALALEDEARALEQEITAILNRVAPGLLSLTGVGPIVAAQLLISYSHPGRFRSEAAFAALAGVAPIPASSGQTTRHRLNRGGDRQLNRAIRVIALTRMRLCPTTQAYLTRRRRDGKTTREALRCLMRHITRGLYRTLTNIMSGQTPGTQTSIAPDRRDLRAAAHILNDLIPRLHTEGTPQPT